MSSPHPKSLEFDSDYRKRIMYVAGDGGAACQRIAMAEGATLDHLGEAVGLHRRVMQDPGQAELTFSTAQPHMRLGHLSWSEE
jgi:hypothetical protein